MILHENFTSKKFMVKQLGTLERRKWMSEILRIQLEDNIYEIGDYTIKRCT